LDVAARGEGRAFAGDDEDGDLLAAVHPFGDADDVVDQRGAGERVAHVVARQREGGDALVELQAGVVDGGQGHRAVSLWAADSWGPRCAAWSRAWDWFGRCVQRGFPSGSGNFSMPASLKRVPPSSPPASLPRRV